ncbi:MAG: hypothetical protein ABEI52_03855 [Halobacteriaceae archaeon]
MTTTATTPELAASSALCVPVPGLHAHDRRMWSFRQWIERYGYNVDEITLFVMQRLPERTAGGSGARIHWCPVAVRDAIANVCYSTSSNRFRPTSVP